MKQETPVLPQEEEYTRTRVEETAAFIDHYDFFNDYGCYFGCR